MPPSTLRSNAQGGKTLRALLGKARCGVIQLDPSGRIVAANGRARALLQSRMAISDNGGYPSAVRRTDDRALKAMLARALPDRGDETHVPRRGSITVSRPRGRPCLNLHAIPVNGRAGADTGGVAAFVLLVELPPRERVDSNLVAGALGLSPAEARVAAMLAKGHKLREIEAITGPSYGTLRWHLNNIFAKCGVSNQTDLVHLVLSVSADAGAQR